MAAARPAPEIRRQQKAERELEDLQLVIRARNGDEKAMDYLIRRYTKFTTDPHSPLKPLPYFERSLTATTPRVYVLRNNDTTRRALLEARGWRVVADGAHHVGYAR